MKGVPVRIVGSPANKSVAQRLWSELPARNHLTGITAFSDTGSLSPSELLLAELDTLDLHHGSYSADPPYTVIEVIGAPLTAKTKDALSIYSFNEFRENLAGFTATRPEAFD
jgi:hypothetical protein